MINLEEPYNKEIFNKFLRDYLPKDARFVEEKLNLDSSYKYFINVKIIARANSLENLSVFEIEHNTSESKRISIANDLFRLLKSLACKNALIITHSKNIQNYRFSNYRFSLVTSSLEWKTDKTVKRVFSNPRRSSFLLGKGAKLHTPYRQLKKKITNFSDLKNCFDIEVVNKEFFENYKNLFLNIKEKFDNDKIFSSFLRNKKLDSDFFSKRLLGQIIFCYFLQKKKWLGVSRDKKFGSGDENYLRNQFNLFNKNKKNFFNEFLEHFFYDGLNDKNKDHFVKKINSKVPYIGGTLFEYYEGYDWKKENLDIPNSYFSNSKKNGILDIFDLYNFTVDENEDYDVDIAVDPEMLGKVFENLISVKDRKSKGTFYTPRNIVKFMCQEVLIEYLNKNYQQKNNDLNKIFFETLIKENFLEFKNIKLNNDKLNEIDKLLKNIRICDPAIGSGAFAVEILNQIVNLRKKIDNLLNRNERSSYVLKNECIQSCIYGVDIDKSAVEIAKLRLWLSLIVDVKDYDKAEPLPNLDYKIIKGNSLYSVEKNLLNQSSFEELEELKKNYYNSSSFNEKMNIRSNIEKILNEMCGNEFAFDFDIFFSEVFNKKKGFDIVITNPPYVVDREISNDLKKFYTSKYKSALYQLNLYTMFIEQSYLLLNSFGSLSLIVPNTWLINKSILSFRKYLLQTFSINKIVDFSKDKVFDATVLPIVFVGSKEKTNSPIAIIDPDNNFVEKFTINLKDISRDGTYLINYQMDPGLKQTLNNIEEDSVVLKTIASISFGAKFYQKNKGDPPQTESTVKKKKYSHSSKINSRCRRVLGGKEIGKYFTNFGNEYIEYGKWLAEPRYPDLFQGDRILLRRIVNNDGFIANLVNEDWVNNSLLHVVKLFSEKIDARYLLALLNSKLIAFYFIKKFARFEKVFPEVRVHELSLMPIIFPKKNIQVNITKIVDEIMKKKKKDINYNIESYTNKLDKIFYEIYNLKKKDIEIVENFNKQD